MTLVRYKSSTLKRIFQLLMAKRTPVPDLAKNAGPAKIVVATTVALSFISFWRAASIVLSDLASSAFYAGGIAEHAIGKSALVHSGRHAL